LYPVSSEEQLLDPPLNVIRSAARSRFTSPLKIAMFYFRSA
jgi:hypothetical protein